MMECASDRRLVSRREWIALAIILAIAALLRLGYLLPFLSDRALLVPVVDASFHDYWARGIATGNWALPPNERNPLIQLNPFAKPPGYVFFLALIYSVTQCSVLAAVLVQMAMGLLNAVLGWRIARWLFGRAAGLVTAAIMGWYWLLIYFEGELLDPTLAITLTLLIALATKRWLVRPYWAWALIAGLLTGALSLVRSNFLPIAPILIVLIALSGRRRLPARVVAAHALLIAAGAAVAIAPVTIRNWRVGREFVLISANSGINLYIGNNPEANLETPVVPGLDKLLHADSWSHFDDLEIVRAVGKKLGRPVGYNEASRYFTRLALDFMRRHPGRMLSLTGRRAVRLLGPVEYSNNKMIVLEREASPVLRRLPGDFTIILVLALGGVVFWMRRPARAPNKRRLVWFMLACMAVLYVSYLLFFLEARFRAPALPFMVILAGLCVVELARMLRRRAFGRFAVCLISGGALYALLWWPTSDYKPSVAYWHFLRSTQYGDRKQYARSRQELEQAFEADRNRPMVALRLGEAYLQARQWQDAERVLAWVVQLKPDYIEALVMLAEANARLGKLENSQGLLVRALRIRPDDETIRGYLATVMEQRNLTPAQRQRVWDGINRSGTEAP
ncbi:glycosyltransferase family 39 protein [bacterium]|nr:glycosyltransferase family 39 protein [bacterium]